MLLKAVVSKWIEEEGRVCDGEVWPKRGSPFLVCVVYISVGPQMCAHVYGGLKLTE